MSEVTEQAKNDEDILLKTILKLLDKAGKDPRLTPRLLRDKAEQRMTLAKGELKSKREQIKVIICDWWKKQKAAQLDRETATLKSVSTKCLSPSWCLSTTLLFHYFGYVNVFA